MAIKLKEKKNTVQKGHRSVSLKTFETDDKEKRCFRTHLVTHKKLNAGKQTNYSRFESKKRRRKAAGIRVDQSWRKAKK